MQYPRIVGIGNGRHSVPPLKTGVAYKLIFAAPLFKVKWRVRHNVANLSVFMQIFGERGGVLFTQIAGNTADGKIHFCKAPGIGVGFLPDDGNLFAASLVLVHKTHTLHKHTTGTAARVIHNAIERLNEFGDELYNAGRRVKFTVLLCAGGSIVLQEIFINPAD